MNGIGWVIGIVGLLVLFVWIVLGGVLRFLSDGTDDELERRMHSGGDGDGQERQAQAGPNGGAALIAVGPCEECGAEGHKCIPYVEWCCARCRRRRGRTHTVVGRARG